MKWSDLPLNPTTRVLRQFSAAWLVVFLALAARAYFARHHHGVGEALAAAALVGVAGLLRPALVRRLFVVATVVAFPIGWAVTQFVLVVMFFVVLTPVALFFRWRGRDEFQLRPKPGSTTFWTAREKTPEAKRYLKQY
jgi:hypothetical protein